MDLIGNLTQSMGLDETAAKALAGAVMGNVAAQAGDADAAVGAQVSEAVPEMGGWMDIAKSYVADGADEPAAEADGGGGLMGSLMGAASSGVGNQLLGAVAGKEAQHAALLGGVLQKIGLDQSKAMMAAPMVASFLKTRMDPAMFDQVMSFAPMLTGQAPAGGDAAGGVMGAIGGMFGGS